MKIRALLSFLIFSLLASVLSPCIAFSTSTLHELGHTNTTCHEDSTTLPDCHNVTTSIEDSIVLIDSKKTIIEELKAVPQAFIAHLFLKVGSKKSTLQEPLLSPQLYHTVAIHLPSTIFLL